jgi:hypothetical protein
MRDDEVTEQGWTGLNRIPVLLLCVYKLCDFKMSRRTGWETGLADREISSKYFWNESYTLYRGSDELVWWKKKKIASFSNKLRFLLEQCGGLFCSVLASPRAMKIVIDLRECRMFLNSKWNALQFFSCFHKTLLAKMHGTRRDPIQVA